MDNGQSIGIFDSGIGGLTVAHRLQQLLPNESIVYLGDTARIPYGTKSRETIIRYAEESAEFLYSQDIKLLVVACGTASCYAMDILKKRYSIPVIGVIAPTVEKAVLNTTEGDIALLATPTTIASFNYQKALKAKLPHCQIHPIACPTFAPFLEERLATYPTINALVRTTLAPLMDIDIETAILGCTHYPLLTPAIQHVLGPHCSIVDISEACAHAIVDTLTEKNLLTPKDSCAEHRYFVTEDPAKFEKLSKTFFGETLDNIAVANVTTTLS